MFTFKDIGVVPANPPAGYVGLYCNGGVLYWIDEAGVTTSIASGAGDLKADGTIPLTANWDVGAFKITVLQLESDIATGTAPLIVASTTIVTNLNADKVDGCDVIDEDNMASDSDVHVPTQQSVRAYIASQIAGGVTYQGGYDASTNTPDLDTAPSGSIKKGWMYTVTVAGTFFTVDVEVGDVLIAEVDAPTLESDWTITQGNIQYTAAQIKALYESNADTNPFTDGNLTQLTIAATAIHYNLGDEYSGASAKPAPVGADRILIEDSADSWAKKYSTIEEVLAVGLPAKNNVQSGTTYTLQDSDNGKNVIFTNSSAIAVDGLEARAVDFHCVIVQAGTGVPTVTPSTDTVNGAGTGVAPDARWKGMYLTQYADTEWLALL